MLLTVLLFPFSSFVAFTRMWFLFLFPFICLLPILFLFPLHSLRSFSLSLPFALFYVISNPSLYFLSCLLSFGCLYFPKFFTFTIIAFFFFFMYFSLCILLSFLPSTLHCLTSNSLLFPIFYLLYRCVSSSFMFQLSFLSPSLLYIWVFVSLYLWVLSFLLSFPPFPLHCLSSNLVSFPIYLPPPLPPSLNPRRRRHRPINLQHSLAPPDSLVEFH